MKPKIGITTIRTGYRGDVKGTIVYLEYNDFVYAGFFNIYHAAAWFADRFLNRESL